MSHRSMRPTRRRRRGCTSQLSADGLRVLAVAYRWLEARDAYSRADEAHLVLAGFVSFADPALDDVAEVLDGAASATASA